MATLVKHNIPGLRRQIDEQYQASRATLQEIGEEDRTASEVVLGLRRLLQRKLGKLRADLTEHVDRFALSVVKKTTELVTPDWTGGHLLFNTFAPSFFQGEEAFKACLAELADEWNECAERLVSSVDQRFGQERCIESDLYASDFEEAFRDATRDLQRKAVGELKATLVRTAKQCSMYGTINHYVESTSFDATESAAINDAVSELVHKMIDDETVELDEVEVPREVDHRGRLVREASTHDMSSEERATAIKQAVVDAYRIVGKRKKTQSIKDAQCDRLFYAVKAYAK